MSNIINLDDLRKEFQEKLSKEEWVRFAEAQQQLMLSYESQINLLTEKNKQLEKLLMAKHDLATPVSTEESICVQQIHEIGLLSNTRALTLEEVKRLDLLVKNLKLVREESTIVLNARPPAKLEEHELVAIIQSENTDS